jgi:hypothetical protein
MDVEVQHGEDLVVDGDDLATDPESKRMDELEKMLWERISKNGFASLWMALGMWCNFRYSDYNEDLGMMKRLVFCLEVGSLSFILDGWLKLSRFQGMVIWYLGYFVCLAFEVNIAVFLRQQCAVLPWQCLPIYVSTLMVYVFVATHGPWSLVLFPMRLIYNFLAEREEDARSVAMKLCILISIELLLYVYCQDYDIVGGKCGTVAKCTLTMFHYVVMPVTKTVLSAAMLFYLAIYGSAILVVSAERALLFVRRHPAWFQGHMHLN